MSSLSRTVAGACLRASSAMKATPEASTRLNSWLNWLRQAGRETAEYTAFPASHAASIGAVPYHWSPRHKIASTSSRPAMTLKPSTASACSSDAARAARSDTCSHTARTSNLSASDRIAGRYCPSQRLPRPTIATPNFMPCLWMVMNLTQSLQKQLVPVHAVSLYQQYPCGTMRLSSGFL